MISNKLRLPLMLSACVQILCLCSALGSPDGGMKPLRTTGAGINFNQANTAAKGVTLGRIQSADARNGAELVNRKWAPTKNNQLKATGLNRTDLTVNLRAPNRPAKVMNSDSSYVPSGGLPDRDSLRRAAEEAERAREGNPGAWVSDIVDNASRYIKPRKTVTNPRNPAQCEEERVVDVIVKPGKRVSHPKAESQNDECETVKVITKPRKTVTNPKNPTQGDECQTVDVVVKPGKQVTHPKAESQNDECQTADVVNKPGKQVTHPKVESQPDECQTADMVNKPGKQVTHPKVESQPDECQTADNASQPRPQVTSPQATYPQVTCPQPQPTSPQVTCPQATYPQATYPQVTCPQPQPTNPQVTSPMATYPQVTCPQPQPGTWIPNGPVTSNNLPPANIGTPTPNFGQHYCVCPYCGNALGVVLSRPRTASTNSDF